MPLGIQTRFELYTWGEGLGFGVWLSPSKLGPLRWNASRGVCAACTLFTADHCLLTVGGVLQAAGSCQSYLMQAVCSQHEAAVSRLQHTGLMGKEVLDSGCGWWAKAVVLCLQTESMPESLMKDLPPFSPNLLFCLQLEQRCMLHMWQATRMKSVCAFIAKEMQCKASPFTKARAGFARKLYDAVIRLKLPCKLLPSQL